MTDTPTADAVRVVIDATKGHHVDNRFMVACNIVGALREAGMMPYPTDHGNSPQRGSDR